MIVQGQSTIISKEQARLPQGLDLAAGQTQEEKYMSDEREKDEVIATASDKDKADKDDKKDYEDIC